MMVKAFAAALRVDPTLMVTFNELPRLSLQYSDIKYIAYLCSFGTIEGIQRNYLVSTYTNLPNQLMSLRTLRARMRCAYVYKSDTNIYQ